MVSWDWEALDNSPPQRATTTTAPSKAQPPPAGQEASQPSTSKRSASTLTVHATATTSSGTGMRRAPDNNVSSIKPTSDMSMMDVGGEEPRRAPEPVDDNAGDHADDELAGRKDAGGRIGEGKYRDVLVTASITAELVEDMENLLPAVCQEDVDYAGPSETLFDRLILNMIDAQKCHNILLRIKPILARVIKDTCLAHRTAMAAIGDLKGAEMITLAETRPHRTLKDAILELGPTSDHHDIARIMAQIRLATWTEVANAATATHSLLMAAFDVLHDALETHGSRLAEWPRGEGELLSAAMTTVLKRDGLEYLKSTVYLAVNSLAQACVNVCRQLDKFDTIDETWHLIDEMDQRARAVAGNSNLLDPDAQVKRRDFAQRIICKALDDTDPVMQAQPGLYENMFRTLMAVVHCKHFGDMRFAHVTVDKLRRELRTHIEEYICTSARLAPRRQPTTRRHAQSLLFPENIPELPKAANDYKKRQQKDRRAHEDKMARTAHGPLKDDHEAANGKEGMTRGV